MLCYVFPLTLFRFFVAKQYVIIFGGTMKSLQALAVFWAMVVIVDCGYLVSKLGYFVFSKSVYFSI